MRSACARRCASDGACPAGEFCGRFDFRGRDMDSGLPAGSGKDVLQVCRPPLNRPCAAGCGADLCLGLERAVCAPRCASAADCAGRSCIDDGCSARVCAPPCDTLGECPRGYTCDLARIDLRGHGECILIAPPPDSGIPFDAPALCSRDGS